MSIIIEQVATPTDEARRLIEELEEELSRIYDFEQRHGLSVERVFREGVVFFVARVEGEAAGCGGVLVGDGWAEVKRMYVRPAMRGRGVGRAILARLEEEAGGRGVRRMVLETGDAQGAAMRMYERAGYVRCGVFGEYAKMGTDSIVRSVFMEKGIG